MFLGEDGAVVTVGLHLKVLSPGIGRPLLRSPGSEVTDALVAFTIVADLVADALVSSILVTDAMVADVVIADALARDAVSRRIALAWSVAGCRL